MLKIAESCSCTVLPSPKTGMGLPKTSMGLPKTSMGLPKTGMGLPRTGLIFYRVVSIVSLSNAWEHVVLSLSWCAMKGHHWRFSLLRGLCLKALTTKHSMGVLQVSFILLFSSFFKLPPPGGVPEISFAFCILLCLSVSITVLHFITTRIEYGRPSKLTSHLQLD